MQLTRVETDGRAASTGPLMERMVRRYHRDMLPWAHLSLAAIFEIVKNIPFRPDPPCEETLMRPIYTMRRQGTGGDCDDKCIVIASWAYLHGGRNVLHRSGPLKQYDYKFVAVRRPDRFDLHHVFLELYINGMWVHVDPTYSFNTLGREREYYAEYVTI